MAPAWGVTLAYWLHMLATVAWIGGLAALALLVLPSAGRVLSDSAYATLLNDIQRRLDILGWFSLAVLTGTGLVQMSASPHYRGFLSIGNLWAGAILLKHLAILGMTGLSVAITWGVLPRLGRAVLRLERSKSQADDPDRLAEVQRARRALVRLIQINLLLSVVVLALTAIARAS
jgi:uncharacterized membrane protein